jgi:hypothetical protein
MGSMREIVREILSLFVAISFAGSGWAQATKGDDRIEIYVTPYYNSAVRSLTRSHLSHQAKDSGNNASNWGNSCFQMGRG